MSREWSYQIFFIDSDCQMYENDFDMTILLSKKQVMEEYGLGRHLLDKAMARKEISYIKLERRVLFRREHIEEYLMRNTVTADVSKKLAKEIKRRIKKRGSIRRLTFFPSLRPSQVLTIQDEDFQRVSQRHPKVF